MKEMKTGLLCIIFMSLAASAWTDSNKDRYIELLLQDKTEVLLEHLEEWKMESGEDPELSIAYFNYYLHMATIVEPVQEEIPRRGAAGTRRAALPSRGGSSYDPEYISLALEQLDQGILRHPDRLDMYMGKAYLLGVIREYEEQSRCIGMILERSRQNENQWLWSDGETVADGRGFMFFKIQEYLDQWGRNGSKDAMEALKTISRLEIEQYPESTLGYNNLANYNILINKNSEALRLFLQAEEIDPDDPILLINIALAYANQNELSLAQDYLDRVIEMGGEYGDYAKSIREQL